MKYPCLNEYGKHKVTSVFTAIKDVLQVSLSIIIASFTITGMVGSLWIPIKSDTDIFMTTLGYMGWFLLAYVSLRQLVIFLYQNVEMCETK